MQRIKEYDVVVIGGGSGLTAAYHAVDDGKSVAVIEQREDGLGGTCVHRGCIPTKGLLHVAKLVEAIETAGAFGFEIDERGVALDVAAVMAAIRKRRTLDAARVQSWVDKYAFPFYGRAHFVDDRTVELEDGVRVRGETVFIASGARPAFPAVPGLETADAWTNEDVLELTMQPSSVIVLGGGYIGAELGCFFAAVGSRVTLVEPVGCLQAEDRDVRALFVEAFGRRVDLRIGYEAIRASGENGMRCVEIARAPDETAQRLQAEGILVATGREPNTDTLELWNTDVAVDADGWIRVDERLRTTHPRIYAYGDVIGQGMFKHTSSYEGGLAYRNAQGAVETVSYRANPHAVFTIPEIGSVGLTEDACEAEGIEYRVRKQDYDAVARGRIEGSPRGFAKLLLEPDTDRILGFHVIGPRASELIHEVVVAMNAGDGTAEPVRRAIHVHPTMNELVQAVFG